MLASLKGRGITNAEWNSILSLETEGMNEGKCGMLGKKRGPLEFLFLRQESTAKLSRCLLRCTGNEHPMDPGSLGTVCTLKKPAGIAHEWTGAESRETHKASSPVSLHSYPVY